MLTVTVQQVEQREKKKRRGINIRDKNIKKASEPWIAPE